MTNNKSDGPFVLFLSLNDGGDGGFLRSVDFEAASPFNPKATGDIKATDNPDQAMTFDTVEAATACYNTQSTTVPLRPDGKPNKPLTAFNALVVTQAEARTAYQTATKAAKAEGEAGPNYPFDEVAANAQRWALKGATVIQKWTCGKCGHRLAGSPGHWTEMGKCEDVVNGEVCGHVTNLRETGCNFMLIGAGDVGMDMLREVTK